MQQLPTAAAVTPKVARALAAVDAVKRGADPEVVECLDAIADMVRMFGDPDLVFERVADALQQENLRALAAVHGLRLYESTQASVDDGTLTEVAVFWPSFAILPRGQKPAESLAQLRAAVVEREREQRLAADFQASVAAGHVEDVDTWYDRTARAWTAR